MGRYLVLRVLNMVPQLLIVTLLAFCIMHLAPGGPENMLMAAEDATMDPSRTAALRAHWGLDEPIHLQYLRWLRNAASGDFGTSYFYRRPVSQVIGTALPSTLRLQLAALVLTFVIAIPLGIASAAKRYSAVDYAVTGLAFAGQAAPSFWVAILLVWGVAMRSGGVLPTHGSATPGVDFETYRWISVLGDRARYMVLPLVVLVFGGMTGLTRYMRSSMLAVLREEYIRTARAKGLSERVVIYKHALRNALLPIAAIAGGLLSSLVGGAVIVETIFAWPGIGRVGYDAVTQRDYNVSMAILLMSGVLTMVGHLFVDIAYVWVDPRIKYD